MCVENTDSETLSDAGGKGTVEVTFSEVSRDGEVTFDISVIFCASEE